MESSIDQVYGSWNHQSKTKRLDRAFGPFIYSFKEIGLLRFLVQQIFEILFSLWVQAYAGYTEGFPEGMWHCRGMCTFGISKILVKEGGGMVSAHSEGDLAPKKVPWRPCAKIMSFNETFCSAPWKFLDTACNRQHCAQDTHVAHNTTWCKEYKTELPAKLTRSPTTSCPQDNTLHTAYHCAHRWATSPNATGWKKHHMAQIIVRVRTGQQRTDSAVKRRTWGTIRQRYPANGELGPK